MIVYGAAFGKRVLESLPGEKIQTNVSRNAFDGDSQATTYSIGSGASSGARTATGAQHYFASFGRNSTETGRRLSAVVGFKAYWAGPLLSAGA